MLRVEHLSKSLSGFRLDDISFHLPKGYIMGIAGPNGAGKSTLVHIILGLMKAQEGKVYIDGTELWEAERVNKDKMGFVLTENPFLKDISAEQNGKLFGPLYSNFDEKKFSEYIEAFGVDKQTKVGKLSKGEVMKFQFAFALAHRPELLILDEPSANFDPEFHEIMMEELAHFIEDGTRSILYVTHQTEELDRLADYVTVLSKGRVVFSLEKESMYKQYQMVSGEDYKVSTLPGQQIIYKEKGMYSTRALVKREKYMTIDSALQISRPTVQELLYFMAKGGAL